MSSELFKVKKEAEFRQDLRIESSPMKSYILCRRKIQKNQGILKLNQESR
jgi:hypothetical protein